MKPAELLSRLEMMQRPDFRTNIARVLGAELVRQVGFGFETRSDPYGAYWQPRKYSYSWPILEKTGAMRGSFRITGFGPDFVRIGSNSPYAQFHQFGTRRLAIRRLVPVADRGLGVWTRRISVLVEQQIRAALGR